MVESFMKIPKAVDPHLRRWMLFVDGENFTFRAQDLAKTKGVKLQEGMYYSPDVFVWLPNVKPTDALTNTENTPVKVQPHAIRSYFYTSVVGDSQRLTSVTEALWHLGFHPEVFKKDKKDAKAKGVDIALTKDLLSHAFLNNYDVAVLIAGDGDYVPLITEVKRQGKVVYVAFFSEFGLNPNLRLASDMFFKMDQFFIQHWKKFDGETRSATAG